MGATILSWSGQMVADLATGQFGRTFTVPVPFKKLRIGVRIFKSTAGALAGTPRLAIGFQRGTTNLPADATSDYFVGIRTTSANWNDSAGFEYQIGTSAAVRNGAAWSYSGAAIKTDSRMVAPAYTVPSPWFVDITEGSPNYTVNLFTPQTGVTDMSQSDFLSTIVMNTPAWTGCTWGTAQAIAADDQATALRDTVAISWDRTNPDIYIADLAVLFI